MYFNQMMMSRSIYFGPFTLAAFIASSISIAYITLCHINPTYISGTALVDGVERDSRILVACYRTVVPCDAMI